MTSQISYDGLPVAKWLVQRGSKALLVWASDRFEAVALAAERGLLYPMIVAKVADGYSEADWRRDMQGDFDRSK